MDRVDELDSLRAWIRSSSLLVLEVRWRLGKGGVISRRRLLKLISYLHTIYSRSCNGLW